MMLCLWILVVVAVVVDGYDDQTRYKSVTHGSQLTIQLPKQSDKLEFIPSDLSAETLLWDESRHHRPIRGRVTGSGSDRRFIISPVTFNDQGTYTQKNIWNKQTYVLKVTVNTKNDYIDRVAGETLYISLAGISKHEAMLIFSGADANITLVQNGSPVGRDHLDYWDRIKVTSSNIEVRNVNTSDAGSYMLKDQFNRLVSVTRMRLVDEHEGMSGNPLLALLLLLGIPAGICCCCRKKIFKKNSQATSSATMAAPTEGPHSPPGSPPSYMTPTAGPMPPGPPGQGYNPGYPQGQAYPPSNPGAPQWSGQPSPGFNPAYPPQNPVYPPAPGPGAPPAPYNGPPGQYIPPAQPAGYAPVMYSAPPAPEPTKEEIKMNDMSTAAPLLTPPKPENTSDILHSSNSAEQFNLEDKRNFL